MTFKKLKWNLVARILLIVISVISVIIDHGNEFVASFKFVLSFKKIFEPS